MEIHLLVIDRAFLLANVFPEKKTIGAPQVMEIVTMWVMSTL